MSEVWTNLNRYLTLGEKLDDQKKQLTALLIDACTKNKKEDVIAAIRQGAYINAFDEFQTPLMACVESDSLELAQYLLKIGASPSVMVVDKDAFWLCLYRQKYDFLKLFFEGRYKQNTLKADNNKTLLIYSTEKSDLLAVEIIAYKVNVNAKDSTGSTALHYNLAKAEPTSEDTQIGKILMACGADTNSANAEGLTPKDLAVSESADILLEHREIEESLDDVLPIIEEETPEEKKKFKL